MAEWPGMCPTKTILDKHLVKADLHSKFNVSPCCEGLLYRPHKGPAVFFEYTQVVADRRN